MKHGIAAFFYEGEIDGQHRAVGFRIPYREEHRLKQLGLWDSSVTKPEGTKEGRVMKALGGPEKPRSVTKTDGPNSRGGSCQSCGKALPGKATKRRKFCGDTCRQAGHRLTVPSIKPRKPKSPLPERLEEAFPMIIKGLDGGLVEVWHHQHGRGVLNVLDPYINALSESLPADRYGIMDFREARCRFQQPKHWLNLPWSEVHVLAWHPYRPSYLSWFPWNRNISWRRRRIRVVSFDALEKLDYLKAMGGPSVYETDPAKFFATRKRTRIIPPNKGEKQ